MKYTLTLLMFIGLILYTFSCITIRNEKDSQLYRVYKIDSIHNYYLIYVQKEKQRYKIVSKKENNINSCHEIKVGKYYNFKLISMWDTVDTIYSGDTFALVTNYNVSCIAFDDSTFICIEKDSINDLHIGKNIKGLCLIDN